VRLTLYERKALMALMLCGVADAATLCREGSVPTSKIYLAMEKLAGLGLVQVQPTRPKMFAALPSEVVVARIVDIVREPSEHFAFQAPAAGSYRLSMATARRSSSRVPSRTAGRMQVGCAARLFARAAGYRFVGQPRIQPPGARSAGRRSLRPKTLENLPV
jgi:Sugar-specific transcriptional regulator TrmB